MNYHLRKGGDFLCYGHRYYSDAERLKAVKGYMNAGMPVSKYAEIIKVNARALREWIRALRSFNGGFINITKAAYDPSKLVTNYGMEMEVLEPDQVKKKFSNFTRFDRDIIVIEIGKMKLTTSLGCARELLSKEIMLFNVLY